MTKEQLASLIAQAKECQVAKDKNPELQQKFYETLQALPHNEQDEFISALREKSIAVWGQAPQTHTGYGVARETYGKVLTERLIDASMTRISLVQNGQGSSEKAKNIEKSVIGKMVALPEDLFTEVSSSIGSYTVPTKNKGLDLTQDAKNRIAGGLRQVKDALSKAEEERALLKTQEESEM